MKTLGFKKYMIYMDDGKDCFKLAIPARSISEAIEFVEGNGEVINIKDVTKEFPISVERVGSALAQFGFGEHERDLITRTLLMTNIAD